MTWASQAYNPGSNPGDRIFCLNSNIDAEKQIDKKTDTMRIIFRKKEGEQISNSVSLLTYLNANNISHIHN
jgi:hypothetical protein